MGNPKRTHAGAAIRKMRVTAGLKQDELAAHLRIDQSQVSVMETGRRKVPLLALLSCADICGFELHLVEPQGSERIVVGGPAKYLPRGARGRRREVTHA